MVGKPNLSPSADDASLDYERQLSMADEGGAAGAVLEAEDRRHQPPSARHGRSWAYAALGLLTATAGFGLLLAARRRL